MSTNLSRNIYRLYIIKTAKWFSLIMPIVVLFFQENGLTMTEIFWLKSVYSMGIVVFEIPSGYFADIWGRKKTLIVGTILTTIGFSIYGFSAGFFQFIIAELILGIGQSFISGADSAMLYDSLKFDQKENQYIKYEGRVISVGNFSEAIAGLLGGLLATISLRTPFIAQTIVSAVAIPAAFTLIEPHFKIKNRAKGLNDIFNVIRYTLIDHTKLRNFILFSSLIGAATLTFAWFIQPFLIEIKMPLPLFGVIWTILNLTVGFASIFAHRIEKYFNEKQITGFIYISLAIGFVITGLWISYFMLIMVFIIYIIRGIATPVLKDYIHTLINSEVRATVLSLRDMFIRIIFAMTGPVWGWVIDHYSLKSGFLVAGIFFLISGSILYYFSYYSNSSSSPSYAKNTFSGK
jgi:MFS family permease